MNEPQLAWSKKQKHKPEFKDLTFDTVENFDAWLEKTTVYTVEFVDNGQDTLIWHLDIGGEVLNCKPFQAQIWNGKIVDLKSLEYNKNISIIEVPNGKVLVMDFIVKSITEKLNRGKS